MGRSTSQLRVDWAPACTYKRAVLLPAYRALDIVLENHGYRPEPGHTGAHACRRITGGSGYSLHAYGPGDKYIFWTGVAVWTAVAVDINWRDNPFGKKLVTNMTREMIDDVYEIKTVDGLTVWFWGGDFNSVKDGMHFELDVSPAQLARGVVMPGATPSPPPPSPPSNDNFKEDVMGKQQLSEGSRGADVKILQGLLVGHGVTPGSWFGPAPHGQAGPDGIFGSGLEERLKAWQRYVGLAADGICGPNTWRRLLLL